eukprot:2262228-Prymnesium_polylepis.1
MPRSFCRSSELEHLALPHVKVSKLSQRRFASLRENDAEAGISSGQIERLEASPASGRMQTRSAEPPVIKNTKISIMHYSKAQFPDPKR